MCLERELEQRKLIKGYIHTVTPRPATIMDLWQSRIGDHFLGISLTFIDQDWMLWTVPISMSHFPGSHTAEAITVLIATFGLI